MNDAERFNEIIAHHDEDPTGAAEQLRQLWPACITYDDRPRASWLINHLFGEKLGRWAEADSLQRQLGDSDTRRGVVRNRAIAALLSAAPLEAWCAEHRLLAKPNCTYSQASLVVRLGALEHLVAATAVQDVVAALLVCVTEISGWNDFGPHADLLAASLNNVVSALVEKTGPSTHDPTYQRALNEGASLCRRLWGVAGTWLNRERAEYLIALCANKIGQFEVALNAAQCGLAIIESGGVQPVDRAFLLLELSRAHFGLEDRVNAESTRLEAFRIAEEFQHPSLRKWFEARVNPS